MTSLKVSCPVARRKLESPVYLEFACRYRYAVFLTLNFRHVKARPPHPVLFSGGPEHSVSRTILRPKVVSNSTSIQTLDEYIVCVMFF